MDNLEKFAEDVKEISAVSNVKIKDDNVIVSWFGAEHNYTNKMRELKEKYNIKVTQGGDNVIPEGDVRKIVYTEIDK